MYFAVAKLHLDWDSPTQHDSKILKKTCADLQKKFSVIAKSYLSEDMHTCKGIAVTFLTKTEHLAQEKITKIANHIEKEGIARIEDEVCLVDHINAFGDEEDEEEDGFDDPDMDSEAIDGSDIPHSILH